MRRAAPLAAALALSGCAEGTDYGALWIEHGPGWWPVLGLLLLVIWLSRRRGFLDGLTELSAFGVQLKRDVGRVDAETESLAEEVAELRAEAERMRAAVAALQTEARTGRGAGASAQHLVRGARAPRVVVDGGGDPLAGASERGEARLRVILRISGGLVDGAGRAEVEREVEIGARPFLIGRDPQADWTLDDPGRTLSRRHLDLRVVGGRLHVCDHSSAGTALEDPGDLLAPGRPTPLEDPALLHLGPGTLNVRVAGPGASPEESVDDVFGSGGAEIGASPDPAPPPAAPPPAAPDSAEFKDLLRRGFGGAMAGAVKSLAERAGGPGGDAATASAVEAMLSDPRFEWRSLGRLAAETGLSEAELRAWLAARPERYRLGESASGRPLARLRRR